MLDRFHVCDTAAVCAQEAELAQGEAQRMAQLADAETQRCLVLERKMEEDGSAGLLADKDR